MARSKKQKRIDCRYKGKVGVRSFKGRLSLRLPRSLFDGEQKIVALGLQDNADNWRTAEQLARDIEWDIKNGRFDRSLGRYGLVLQDPSNALTPSENISPSPSLVELLEAYVQARQGFVAPSTWAMKYKQSLGRLKSSPFADISADLTQEQSCEFFDWLISNFARDTARNTLATVNSCLDWAIERSMIPCLDSPLKGFSARINQTFTKVKNEINPFTSVERDMIIQAFEENPTYEHYCSYVKFCFFTGCRPSEAIGLEWDDIAPDFSWIRFHKTIVMKFEREGLKTQAQRIFPCNDQLKTILTVIQENSKYKYGCVFTNKKGMSLPDSSFLVRPWKKIINTLPIAYRSPYHTRHTFITLCLDKGMDVKDVAYLVGNSPQIIYKHYAGRRLNIEVPTFERSS